MTENVLERMENELEELESRYKKLRAFLTEKGSTLSGKAFELLTEQGLYMKGYLRVLSERIVLFEKERDGESE